MDTKERGGVLLRGKQTPRCSFSPIGSVEAELLGITHCLRCSLPGKEGQVNVVSTLRAQGPQ